MKIERKAIKGVEEVPEDMKNAAIARKKAFAEKAIPKKKASKVKKVVAEVTKPVTVKSKIVAKMQKAMNKKKRRRNGRANGRKVT